jgi:hypothetical protein
VVLVENGLVGLAPAAFQHHRTMISPTAQRKHWMGSNMQNTDLIKFSVSPFLGFQICLELPEVTTYRTPCPEANIARG